MTNQFKTILVILSVLASSAFAKVKVGKVKLTKDGNIGVVTVDLKGDLKSTPELTIKNDIVQIALKETIVWPKIDKQATVNKKFDTKLMAYQYSKDLVRVRAVLPYKLNGREDEVSLEVEDNQIKLFFPVVKTKNAKVAKTIKRSPKKVVTAKTKADQYDESYLDKLLKDKETVAKNDSAKKLDNTENSLVELSKTTATKIEDSVNSISSATKKGGFEMSSYIFKFIGFFAIFAAGIFFLMNFFRKGMLKKGGLGIFSNAKMVEVLSTTYLGPKRSILVVRVQKQIFLMAQSEKGMDFLTEITDTADFIKEGEKSIIGSNFDTNLDTANNGEKEFKLKEVASTIGNEASSQDDILAGLAQQSTSEDKVSLTAQIKKRVKDLKSLQ